MRSRSDLFAFLLITFAFTWGCWIPAVFSEDGLYSPWARCLGYAGALGPGGAGIALTCLGPAEERDDYRARIIDFSRIHLAWLTPVFILYPLVTLVSLLLDAVLTGSEPRLETASRLLGEASSIPAFLMWTLLLGPLPEELGWRGYALERLQRHRTALASSLILGLIWATWHLPLFFIKGSYQYNLGFASVSFWSYSVTIVALSVLFTWIHNNNARSIQAAVLFHFVLNLTGSVVQGSATAEVSRTILLVGTAAFVVHAWTPATLSGRRQRRRGASR